MPAYPVSQSIRTAKKRHAVDTLRVVWVYDVVQRLKTEEGRLRLDFDSAKSPKDRQDAARALLAHRSAMAEFLLLPKRPASPKWERPSYRKFGRPGAGEPVEIDVPAVKSPSSPS